MSSPFKVIEWIGLTVKLVIEFNKIQNEKELTLWSFLLTKDFS